MSEPSSFARALPPALYERAMRQQPIRFPTTAAAPRAIRIDGRWRLRLDDSCGPLAHRAANDLRNLLRSSFDVNLATRGEGPAIDVMVQPDAAAVPEQYRWQISEHGAQVRADDDEGAMRALFRLGWEMLERRGPWLPLGNRAAKPRWKLRITSPLIHRPQDTPGDYLALPEAYLLNMARHGYNATYFYADWFDYMRPQEAPGLARPGWQNRLAELRRCTQYLGQFGIRLLFHVNTLVLPADHAFFRANPKTRGAQTWSEKQHCLCSSARQTLELYEAASRRLFEDVPELAGLVLIVGGECFIHCYTRPFPKPPAGTNCPVCRGRKPERVVAGVVNAVARGAWVAQPQAHVLMWPYSAFSWGDAAVQRKMLANLDARVACLGTFEKDDWITVEGVRSYVFDYSITSMGPSPLFKTLAAASRAQGRPVMAKTETSQCVEMFNVPRIPIMQRWAERFTGLAAANLDGLHTTWRFYGFCGQRTDELMDQVNWTPKPQVTQILARMAQRDFGPKAAAGVLNAWNHFSEAFALFPYGGGPTGFPYFRGPFFLGPAHPFVFDLTAEMGLPPRFWAADPSWGEIKADAESMPREPRFFMDLTWTQPFGAAIVARRLTQIDRRWTLGMRELDRTRPRTVRQDRDRLDDERRIAGFIGCMFRTALHLVRFQMLRERITAQPCTLAQLRGVCQQALSILRVELANAQAALEMVEADGSLGYGATYGRALDAELIAAKIAHTQRQIAVDVPRFFSIHAFHMFGRSETLGHIGD